MKSKLILGLITILSLGAVAEETNQEGRSDQQPAEARLQAASPFSVIAQEPMTQEQMKERIKRSVAMHNEMTIARLKSFSDPELAKAFAQFSRAYYEALIAVGFSEKEALEIVVNVGIPDFR